MIMFWCFIVYLSVIMFLVFCTVSFADYVLVLYSVSVADGDCYVF